MADRSDFTELRDPAYFDMQTEQFYAYQNYQNGGFVEEIQHQHRYLSGVDLIIFQFPLWWYSVPAIIKKGVFKNATT